MKIKAPELKFSLTFLKVLTQKHFLDPSILHNAILKTTDSNSIAIFIPNRILINNQLYNLITYSFTIVINKIILKNTSNQINIKSLKMFQLNLNSLKQNESVTQPIIKINKYCS